MLMECQRILKTTGFYVCVSFHDSRDHHLLGDMLSFKIKKHTILRENKHAVAHVYVCQKLEGADEKCKAN